MDITKEFIKAKQPCTAGFRWYLRNAATYDTYQQLLDALVAEDRIDDACWLLDQFGPMDTVRTLDHLESTAVVFAGSLRVQGNIDVDSVVRVGRDLHAAGGIRAGQSITAGGDVNCDAALLCKGAVSVGGDLLVAWNFEADGETSAERVRVGWDFTSTAGLCAQGDVWVGQALHLGGALAGSRGLRVGDELRCASSVEVKHGVECGGTVICGGHLAAGWGISAKGAVHADGAIRVGESIFAGEDICAGDGYGIYAGLVVRSDTWEASAQVRASQYPDELRSGWWAGSNTATSNL